jgi:phenylalanyl-tRNA synthetase beta chain
MINNETMCEITPPTWRYDLTIMEDYAEEVIRLVGFTHLSKTPLSASVPQWKRSRYWRSEYIKDILVALGMNEIQTYPFMSLSEANLLNFNPESLLEITTAPIKDKNFLRPNLLPSMLTAISTNPETPQIALFEIAHVYHQTGEIEQLIIGIAGQQSPMIDDLWQNVFERFRLPVSSWMSRVKTMDQSILDFYKIRKPIVTILELPLADFEIGKLYDLLPVTIPDLDLLKIKPLSMYQTSRRDVACLVDTTYDSADIQKQLESLDQHIVSVILFDRYTNAEKLGPDKQSLGLRITYQSPTKTLSSEEIDALQTKVETYIKDNFHGIIR